MRYLLKHSNNAELIGISLRIASGIGFAVMSGLIKYLDDAIPLGEVVFFRSCDLAPFPIRSVNADNDYLSCY